MNAKDLAEFLAAETRQYVDGAVAAKTEHLRAELVQGIAAAVTEAVKQIPPAEPGKDADAGAVKEQVLKEVMGSVREAIATMRSLVGELVTEAVTGAVALIPPPKDGDPGEDADMAAVEALVAKQVGEAVVAIPPAKDGVGITGALVDRSGDLVLTLSNGATLGVGRVIGKDADPATPGRDGLGFDDLSVDYDGEREITLVFQRGEVAKRFPFTMPIVLDRGVFDQAKTYEKGDGVSWAGSFWIAQEKTNDKPGDGKTAWRLAVKKGRDMDRERGTSPIR